MINASSFEKSIAIFEKIKTLDKEIISIEKLALILADTETDEVKVALSVRDKDVNPESKEPTHITMDRWLERRRKEESYMGLFSYFDNTPKEEKPKSNFEKIEDTVNVNAGMQVLGVLLANKIDRRNKLIDKLNKIGIQL